MDWWGEQWAAGFIITRLLRSETSPNINWTDRSLTARSGVHDCHCKKKFTAFSCWHFDKGAYYFNKNPPRTDRFAETFSSNQTILMYGFDEHNRSFWNCCQCLKSFLRACPFHYIPCYVLSLYCNTKLIINVFHSPLKPDCGWNCGWALIPQSLIAL